MRGHINMYLHICFPKKITSAHPIFSTVQFGQLWVSVSVTMTKKALKPSLAQKYVNAHSTWNKVKCFTALTPVKLNILRVGGILLISAILLVVKRWYTQITSDKRLVVYVVQNNSGEIFACASHLYIVNVCPIRKRLLWRDYCSPLPVFWQSRMARQTTRGSQSIWLRLQL